MLRQSNQELGQTVLMITHNPEAAAYGDRIIHMRDGEIVDAGERSAVGGTLKFKALTNEGHEGSRRNLGCRLTFDLFHRQLSREQVYNMCARAGVTQW